VKFEIGHVLFIDIVGYSKLLINEQSEQIQKLKQIVRGTEQFRLAEAEGKLLRLPTGDGGALVFRNSPEAPVLCALEITKELQNPPGSKEKPQLRLRMGIHSGPVNEVTDLNEQANIAGAGINIAQRVMDCGDAGHILLSKRVAEDLGHYGQWQPQLHDLGEVDVKHGVRIGIVNFCGDQFGNPVVPEKIAARRQEQTTASQFEEKRSRRKRRLLALTFLAITTAVIVVSIIAYRMSQQISQEQLMRQVASLIPEKSVAVLPFENLTGASEDAFLSTGIQDEILTRLSKIAALKVISRTSTKQYESKPGNLSDIAKQLGVATILEGSVQKVGAKIRVNVQLIKAATDAHLWAETYDRDLIDVLAVESNIATEIASALRAALTPEEKEQLATRPTNNAQAYEFYLRAREILAGENNTRTVWEKAGNLFDQAVAQDPGFAAAHAGRAFIFALLYTAFEPRDEYKTKALSESLLAVQLDPKSVPGHSALAFCLNRIEGSYEAAAREYEIALRIAPNDANLIRRQGLMRRQQGHWRDGLASLEKAAVLDPQNISVLGWLAGTYEDLHEWKKSDPMRERVVALSQKLSPEALAESRFIRGFAYFDGTGDSSLLNKAMAETPAGIDQDGLITQFRYAAYMLEHRFDEAERVIVASSQVVFENPWGTPSPKSFLQGGAVAAKGETARAQKLFEAALPYFQKDITDHPEVANRHAALGILLAYLGRKPEALAEAQRASELLPESKDAYYGLDISNMCAIIFARLGDADRALPLIDRLLRTPRGLALQELRFSPDWNPLRSDSRFQKILANPEPKVIYN
jgi:TolB-like protein/Tfp pilus assembly protein PilF